MRRLFENRTVRGLAIVALVAVVVVVLSLEPVLATTGALLRIAFFLAVAFFVYLMWRERRGDISTWPTRAQFAFYGAAILALVAIGIFILYGASGQEALAFFLILGLCGFSMFRTWRDQHTYG